MVDNEKNNHFASRLSSTDERARRIHGVFQPHGRSRLLYCFKSDN